MKTKLLLFLLSLAYCTAWAQPVLSPLNREQAMQLDKALLQDQSIGHTAFGPLVIPDRAYRDSVLAYQGSGLFYRKPTRKLWKKLHSENLLRYREKEFVVEANPLFWFYYANEQGQKQSTAINSRGVELKGHIGKKLYFYSSFYENQAYFSDYVNDRIQAQGVVNGEGVRKSYTGSSPIISAVAQLLGNETAHLPQHEGHDYAYAMGMLVFVPAQHWQLVLGHGKNTIGHGYRSLLLSDNAMDYPFARISYTRNKWQYTSLFAQYQNFEGPYYAYHWRKHGTVNYLSYLPAPFIELGLFESTVWQTTNGSRTNHFPASFFIPVIMSRTAIYGLHHKHNVMLGLNAKLNIANSAKLYGQLVLDDLDNGKNGFQLGAVYYDAATLTGLNLQLEYNKVTAGSYGHGIAHQSYSHMNQALAHPLGANFTETFASLSYRWRSFLLDVKFNYIKTASDTGSVNSGVDIFASQPGDFDKGLPITLKHKRLQLAYVVNSATNFQFYAGLHQRHSSSTMGNNSLSYWFVGMKTQLRNTYFDF